MNRPSFRTIAVAAGFLGVSFVVAGTASAMVGPPADAPVASAVELSQEDPASVTAPVEAGDAATDTDVVLPAPVEVGSAALKCSDQGVCDERHDHHDRSAAPADPPDRTTPAPSTTTPSCEWPTKPSRPMDGADPREWKRAVDEWANAWHATAQECGWDVDSWDRERGTWSNSGDERREEWQQHADERDQHQRDRDRAWDDGHGDMREPRDSWQGPDEGDREGWRERSDEFHGEWKAPRDAWSDHAERRDGGR